jgi:hypothetical protein
LKEGLKADIRGQDTIEESIELHPLSCTHIFRHHLPDAMKELEISRF